MKNIPEKIKSRLSGKEELINELENRIVEITQSEQ